MTLHPVTVELDAGNGLVTKCDLLVDLGLFDAEGDSYIAELLGIPAESIVDIYSVVE